MFDIHLDNPTSTYTPGSLMTGQVILELLKPKTFRALKLRFKGKCKVEWCGEPTGTGSRNTQTAPYTGNEQYFCHDIYLRGGTRGSVELLTGLHTFPFKFQLPRNIPNSFEHSIGNVRYTVKAIIDKPWKINRTIKVIFKVRTLLEFDSSHMQGINDEIYRSFCCFIPCINQGSLIIRFRLPKIGYVCGERIEATVDVDYQTNSVEVIGLRLNLEKTLLFHSQKYDDRNNITCVIKRCWVADPFSKDTKETMGFEVPHVPLSHMQYCSLIDVDYKLKFFVDISGCHFSFRRKYEIIIGSGPISEQQVTDPISNFLPKVAQSSGFTQIQPSASDDLTLKIPPPLTPENEEPVNAEDIEK